MITNANTRFEVAENVAEYLKELEARPKGERLRIRAVYQNLSIFDWWNEYLSPTQLKQMQAFLKTAAKLGFNGYVCFKVGAAGCSHGMWAYEKNTTDGYSPDGPCLYHSFRSGDCYWDCELPDGLWLHEKACAEEKKRGEAPRHDHQFTLKEVKTALAQSRVSVVRKWLAEELVEKGLYDAAVELMDNDIRERLHSELSPCSEADFLAAYMKAHYDVYGSEFVVN